MVPLLLTLSAATNISQNIVWGNVNTVTLANSNSNTTNVVPTIVQTNNSDVKWKLPKSASKAPDSTANAVSILPNCTDKTNNENSPSINVDAISNIKRPKICWKNQKSDDNVTLWMRMIRTQMSIVLMSWSKYGICIVYYSLNLVLIIIIIFE